MCVLCLTIPVLYNPRYASTLPAASGRVGHIWCLITDDGAGRVKHVSPARLIASHKSGRVRRSTNLLLVVYPQSAHHFDSRATSTGGLLFLRFRIAVYLPELSFQEKSMA